MMMPTFDNADRTLLATLQRNAQVKLDQLADETGLSVATVQRRLTQLRRSGVIAGTVAVLDPAALGQAMTFVVLIHPCGGSNS